MIHNALSIMDFAGCVINLKYNIFTTLNKTSGNLKLNALPIMDFAKSI